MNGLDLQHCSCSTTNWHCSGELWQRVIKIYWIFSQVRNALPHCFLHWHCPANECKRQLRRRRQRCKDNGDQTENCWKVNSFKGENTPNRGRDRKKKSCTTEKRRALHEKWCECGRKIIGNFLAKQKKTEGKWQCQQLFAASPLHHK